VVKTNDETKIKKELNEEHAKTHRTILKWMSHKCISGMSTEILGPKVEIYDREELVTCIKKRKCLNS
jgi:hypothetical protein